MPRNNTGNPLPSSSPLDREDNSLILEELINSKDKDFVPDRFGEPLKTWLGMDGQFNLAQYQRQGAFEAAQNQRSDEFDSAQDGREAQFTQLMISGGYTGTGADGAIEDYVAGITVSSYKEIIRENGEFWRAASDTALPYITTGAGMPESGAFVNVGDGVLRQDLVQPVATFNNIEDMIAAARLDIGRKARTLGDGGGNDFEIVAASEGTADGNRFIALDSGLLAKRTGKWEWSSELQPVLTRIGANVTDKWFGRSTCILGDSITHGANSSDIHNDSWAGIFRKLANLEFGSTNQGFVTLNDEIANAVGTYREIHTVTTSGAWSTLANSTALDLINGYGLQSGSVGATVTVKVPTLTRRFRIWFHRRVGGGSISLSVNGTAVASIDTNASTVNDEDGAAISLPYDLTDNGLGECQITLTVASGNITITGVSYFDLPNEFTVNNFSNSGRRIAEISVDVIDAAASSSHALIWALGHNDQGLTGLDRNTVRSRLDALISSAKSYKTKVVIADFCWGKPANHWLRAELMRTARAIPSASYVPFPDLFAGDNSVISTSDLQSTYQFLSDNSHPTPMGHKLIAEIIAKTLCFNASTKKSAEMFDHLWRPIALTNGWKNRFNTAQYLTAWRRNGNSVQIRLNLDARNKTSNVIGVLSEDLEIPFSMRSIQVGDTSAIFSIDIGTGFNAQIAFNPSGGVTDDYIEALITIPINCGNNFERFR